MPELYEELTTVIAMPELTEPILSDRAWRLRRLVEDLG